MEDMDLAHQRRMAMRGNVAWEAERRERWKDARKAKKRWHMSEEERRSAEEQDAFQAECEEIARDLEGGGGCDEDGFLRPALSDILTLDDAYTQLDQTSFGLHHYFKAKARADAGDPFDHDSEYEHLRLRDGVADAFYLLAANLRAEQALQRQHDKRHQREYRKKLPLLKRILSYSADDLYETVLAPTFWSDRLWHA